MEGSLLSERLVVLVICVAFGEFGWKLFIVENFGGFLVFRSQFLAVAAPWSIELHNKVT